MMYKSFFGIFFGILLFGGFGVCKSSVKVFKIREDGYTLFGGVVRSIACDIMENDEAESNYYCEKISILVKNQDDEVIAVLQAAIFKNDEKPSVCYITDLWADEQYEELYLDIALLDALIDYLRTEGCVLVAYPDDFSEHCKEFLRDNGVITIG